MSDTELANPVEHVEIEAANPPVDDTAAVEAMEPADAPAEEEKPKKTKKVVEPHPCLCRLFLLAKPEDDAEFRSECAAETKSQFAQGHDARLVSFLVQGQLDGYQLFRDDEAGRIQFDDAGHAAASCSEALGQKADKAIQNAIARRDEKAARAASRTIARAQAKAEREAAKEKAKAEKAAAPKDSKAKVVEGSQEGDAKKTFRRPDERAEGETEIMIKVGRNEIPALLSADGQTVRWIDTKDNEHNRPIDTVRVLQQA